jgi:hypothetical protein
MKRTLVLLTTLSLAIALALTFAFGVNKIHAQQPAVKAFQIWTHSTDTDLNGQTIVTESYLARRSDGTNFEKNNFDRAWLNVPSSGIRVEYENGNQTTFGLGRPILVADNKSCTANDPDVVAGDNRNILGFDTTHIHFTRSRTDGSKVTKDIWLSLDFDCHPLLSNTDYFDKNGKLVDNSHTEATRATLGEPPAEMLSVGNAVEVPPSKLRSASAPPSLLASKNFQASMAKLDQKYNYQKAVREGRIAAPPFAGGNVVKLK